MRRAALLLFYVFCVCAIVHVHGAVQCRRHLRHASRLAAFKERMHERSQRVRRSLLDINAAVMEYENQFPKFWFVDVDATRARTRPF